MTPDGKLESAEEQMARLNRELVLTRSEVERLRSLIERLDPLVTHLDDERRIREHFGKMIGEIMEAFGTPCRVEQAELPRHVRRLLAACRSLSRHWHAAVVHEQAESKLLGTLGKILGCREAKDGRATLDHLLVCLPDLASEFVSEARNANVRVNKLEALVLLLRS